MSRLARIVPRQSARCPSCGEPDPGPDQCRRCRRFLPGNRLAATAPLTHGTRSPARLQAATDEAIGQIEVAIADGPGSERRYALARHSAAKALARLQLLEAFLDERGLLDAKGRPRPAAKLLNEAHGSFLRHLEALGLTPMSAAKLGVDLGRARNLAEALAEMETEDGHGR